MSPEQITHGDGLSIGFDTAGEPSSHEASPLRSSPSGVSEVAGKRPAGRFPATSPDPFAKPPAGAEQYRKGLASNIGFEKEPIAIVGIGCRFPGAKDLEAFWNLLLSGEDAITEIPPHRLDMDTLYDPRPDIPGKIITRWGGFFERVDGFDSAFFGISPREAATIDPQCRMALEVAWEALEDAGEVSEKLLSSRAGVFIGAIYNDYETLQTRDLAGLNIYSVTQGARAITAGRLSYAFDLRGPSLTVDTACSSSLLAVHLACQSLWAGECPVALAGGVNLILRPDFSIGFSNAKMLAPDGRCKAFDSRANGFVRSEGVGLVVLKPLAQAQADGNPIYAVIRGSAVNNDGTCSGALMTPGRKGQEDVLREAYRDAGIAPGKVLFVEAHGTGTSVGDPVEVMALATVLSEGRTSGQRCILGSVKTNIGHTEGASGIAGLIKTALCLKHRVIPPNLHLQTPNPAIPWEDIPLELPRTLMAWPETPERAIAGVSAFGLSGTNAHIVLEEAPSQKPAQFEGDDADLHAPAHLLTISARSAGALQEFARAYQQLFVAGGVDAASLNDICYTASVRRTHHDHRLALVAHSHDEFANGLQTFLEGLASPAVSSYRCVPDAEHKVVFVFPGQGSQWFGMGRTLLEREPVFRAALEQCEAAMQPYVSWSLLALLTADTEATAPLHEIDQIQPAIFAIQIALATLWRSWSIHPAAVVGHSMGEVAAAHIAGILSLDDAARIICLRSKLMRSISGQGAMAAVGLSIDDARLAIVGYEDLLSIAVSNSPTTTVLSGDPEALNEVLAQLQRRGVFCRPIKVDVASHSPQIDPLLGDLLRVLHGIQPQIGAIPMYSTVTNGVENGAALNATYWVRNLREPVLFSDSLKRLLNDGHDMFIEISPHPILVSPIQQCLRSFEQKGLALPSMQRDEDEHTILLETLGTLYTHGLPIEWERLYPEAGVCVRLPHYPWQHEYYWCASPETPTVQSQRKAGERYLESGGRANPLLQRSIRLATDQDTYYWETYIDTQTFPYLTDHRVQGSIVFPAAAYTEMALASAREAFNTENVSVAQLNFHKALFMQADAPQEIQVVLKMQNTGTAFFQFYSFAKNASHALATLHASGKIVLGQADVSEYGEVLVLPDIQERCQEKISGEAHYRAMNSRGLNYGPCFQGVGEIWRRDGEALARLHLADQLVHTANRYHIHPAQLDACFQILLAAFPTQNTDLAEPDTYLPISLKSFHMGACPPDYSSELWSYARLVSDFTSDGAILEGDAFLLDASGQVLLSACGLRCQRIDQAKRNNGQQNMNDWLYEIQWEEAPTPDHWEPVPKRGAQELARWLILSDRRGVGDTLITALEGHGEACIRAYLAEDYQRVAERVYHIPPTSLEAFQRFFADVSQDGVLSLRGIIHLWSLDGPEGVDITGDALFAAQERSCGSVLHLIQALSARNLTQSPQLILVTRGAQPAGAEQTLLSPVQAPLWGMGRVIFYEHPELKCKLVDLGLATSSTASEMAAFEKEILSGAPEEQVALRGTQRYVARFVTHASALSPAHGGGEKAPQILVDHDHPYCLKIATPGMLDTLELQESVRNRPGPGEIEIQVYATGLNFHDIMLAMGIDIGEYYEGSPTLGLECSGVVTAVGEGVSEFSPGDPVLALAHFSMGTYVVTRTEFAIARPASLSFEEAATIPAVFLTAYYALHRLAHMAPGERVLIHAATGGVGLAAIQLAQLAGAEVFATAGTPEKRALLRSLGVQYVMDSRSLDFADEIMALTNNEGVDIVLNSLAGEALKKSMEVLRTYGRFLEIGKRDIYANSLVSLRPFQNSLAFYAIDLNKMGYDPHGRSLLKSVFREVMQLFAEDKLKPLPYTLFSINEAVDAFRYMTQARHTGKIVVSPRGCQVLITPIVHEPALFKADATYLITGGLGGLGLTIAEWMTRHGAGHLVLLGRREPSLAAQQAIELMQEKGAHVVVAQTDITQEAQVKDILETISQTLPPLRGIIHGAAVLDDSTLIQLNQQRLRAVMAPKILGAWHLHQYTKDLPLDFFVLFSSLAGVIGSPGQSNYSAGNNFLDSLAHFRHARGLPALSINWGIWTEVGLAAAQANRGQRLSNRGFGTITPEQGLETLKTLLSMDVAQISVSPFSRQLWCQFYPSARHAALFARLAEREASSSSIEAETANQPTIKRDILNAPPQERLGKLESYLSSQTAKILCFSEARLDVQQPLNRLGMDSLMAVELRNAIEINLGVTIPVTNLLKGASLSQLAHEILDQCVDEAPQETRLDVISDGPEVNTGVDQLSEQQVDTLLQDLLGATSVLVDGLQDKFELKEAQS